MTEEFNFAELYQQADEEQQKIEENLAIGGKKRDERLLNCKGTRTIYFRMIPRITKKEGGGITMMKYYPYIVNSFKSLKTGNMVYVGTNPSVRGRPDFWKDRQQELWDSGDKDRAKLLFPTPKRLVNVYVIKDTGDESNNKQFKMWDSTAKPTDPDRPRAGSPMIKCLQSLQEELGDEYNENIIYSLGTKGITFKMTIVTPKNPKEFVDVNVIALPEGSTIDGFSGVPDDPQKLGKIYMEKTYDFDEFIEEPKSEEELWKIYNTHILCVENKAKADLSMLDGFAKDATKTETTSVGSVDDDEIPFDFDTNGTASEEKATASKSGTDQEIDDELSKILAGIS